MTGADALRAAGREADPGGTHDGAGGVAAPRSAIIDADDAAIAPVREGYDCIADRDAVWAAAIRGDAREQTTARLLAALPSAADVIDLGCGNGPPTARLLVDRGHRVTAIDVSAEQIARCRASVPEAQAAQADMTAAAFPAGSFHAVLSLYANTHVSRARHASLFHRFVGRLRPGGFLAACLGTGEANEIEADWLGVPMAFSHFAADANLAPLREAGSRSSWPRSRRRSRTGTRCRSSG